MSNRINGERVFCYSCENEWDRAHGGLQCPRCQSEFCEILENGRRPDADDPPEVLPEPPSDYDPLRGFYGHNPWAAPDPDDGDIRTVHFNSGGGGNGSTGYSFSRTYTFGGDRRDPPQQQRNRDPDYYPSLAAQETMRNFESMFTGLLGPAARVGGGHFGGSININGRTTTFGSGSFNSNTTTGPMPMGGLDLMSAIFPTTRNGGGIAGLPEIFQQYLNPANARSGDHVWSQEAFDRVLSQLMEQNAQNGAPPASEDRINALPKKKIDQSMLDNEGKAECSICMDSVEKDTEVTVLPCQHWFHFECIKSWLTEHDTCPHCRKPITPDTQQPTSPRPSGRRRLSRRSNSVASPVSQLRNPGSTDYGRQSPMPIAEDMSPSAMRSAREEYYGRSHQESSDERDQRPSSERRSSRRSTGSGTGRDDGGGVGGWIRNRMNFS